MGYEDQHGGVNETDGELSAGSIEGSTATTAIFAAMAKAQGDLKPAKKDRKNTHFGNEYATLEACMAAFQAAFPKHGFSVSQPVVRSARGCIAVQTRLQHASGEWIANTVEVPINKPDAQGYGSAYTYARRYGLCGLTGITAEEDDDGNAAADRGQSGDQRRDEPRPWERGQQSNGHTERANQAPQPNGTSNGAPKAAPEPRKVDFGPIEVLDHRSWIERARTLDTAGRRKWWGSPSGSRSQEMWGKETRDRVLAAMRALDAGDDIDADGVVVPKESAPSEPSKSQPEPGAAG